MGSVPDPADWAVVELNVESVLLVPHSNQAVVAEPFGFTDPLSVAPLDVMELAAVVCAVGGLDTAARVVKLQVLENALDPPLFDALTRQ